MKSLSISARMVAVVFAGLLTLAMPSTGEAQASLPGGAYTENFDTLASSGTSSTVPTGWAFSEAGANANTTYTAGTGSSPTGDTYSYGTSGSSERAFGELTSNTLQSTIGVQFQNNTGRTIGSLTIAYVCEQWRLGSTGNADRMDFQYSVSATSLTTPTGWSDFNTLDCVSPVTAGAVGALDGNAAANRTALSQTITGLAITDGATFWLRWVPLDKTSNDDGLAVDDFSMTAQGPNAVMLGSLSAGVQTRPLFALPVLGVLAAVGLIVRRRKS